MRDGFRASSGVVPTVSVVISLWAPTLAQLPSSLRATKRSRLPNEFTALRFAGNTLLIVKSVETIDTCETHIAHRDAFGGLGGNPFDKDLVEEGSTQERWQSALLRGARPRLRVVAPLIYPRSTALTKERTLGKSLASNCSRHAGRPTRVAPGPQLRA
jgi:hypothetical protein